MKTNLLLIPILLFLFVSTAVAENVSDTIFQKNMIPGEGVRFSNGSAYTIVYTANHYGNYPMSLVIKDGKYSIRVAATLHRFDKFYTGITLGQTKEECLAMLDAILMHKEDKTSLTFMDEDYGVITITAAQWFKIWLLEVSTASNSSHTFYYIENLSMIREYVATNI